MIKKIKLDVSPLNKAVKSLEAAINEYNKQSANEFIRDAAIQRFEYTYELSHKMLKRYLENTEPNAEQIDSMSFPELIRTASERGLLLNGWDVWTVYRAARNMTSHTYDELKAKEVYDVIPNFLKEASHLLKKLQERLSLI